MPETCHRLHCLLGGLERFRYPFDVSKLPRNGIYVLFEAGEHGHSTDRIVRVGTHTGESQFQSRLKQHFVNENKDRSIFRKNIGRALLNKDQDPFLPQWEIDMTTRDAKNKFALTIDFAKQAEMEQRVTAYIQENFQFVVLREDSKERRLELEAKIISTVSLCGICGPTPNWLGLKSPKQKIREGGLWLVNELYGEPLTENDFAALEVRAQR